MGNVIKKTIVILLILSLGLSTACLAYLHFFKPDDRSLSGEWTAELDLTKQAAVKAFVWLQDIEAVPVLLEDVESGMGKLSVQVDLNLEATTDAEGVFCSGVLSESYGLCEQEAYEAFAEIFRELLRERLRMAGYTGGTEREELESLVTETFGMPTVTYLMNYGPVLLPSLEELQAQYDGSGTFQAAEGILTRQYDNGNTKTENYVWENFRLVLSGAEAPDGQELPETGILIYQKKLPEEMSGEGTS